MLQLQDVERERRTVCVVAAGVVFSLASCKSALAARSLLRGFVFGLQAGAMSLEFSLGPRSFVAYHRICSLGTNTRYSVD